MTKRIVAAMASVPQREDALRQAAESIAAQVDELFVYLNGYDHIPGFLRDIGAVVGG